ncbi:MAG: hypothetical protein ABIO70_29995 [Pseudomonadota bacterium]
MGTTTNSRRLLALLAVGAVLGAGLVVLAYRLGLGEPAPPLPAAMTCASPHRFVAELEPVIAPDPNGTWRTELVSCADIFDLPGGGRAMWFKYSDLDGGSGIGRAIQEGGRWRVEPVPVLTLADLADRGVVHIGCTTTLVEEEGIRVWLRANLSTKERVIYAATSSDGRTLQVLPGEPVLRATEPWMRNSLWDPQVFRDGDLLRMVLRCGDRSRSNICMATGADGQAWSLSDRKVVGFKPLYGGEVLGAPMVDHVAGRWHLWTEHKWYPHWRREHGADQDLEMWSEIVRMPSRNPERFPFDKAEVVLRPGAAPWMAQVVDNPMVVEEGGVPVLYFRGGVRAGGVDGAIGRALPDCDATEGWPSLFEEQIPVIDADPRRGTDAGAPRRGRGGKDSGQR